MAIKTPEQLKEVFKAAYFPTQQDFYDLIESFLHKGDVDVLPQWSASGRPGSPEDGTLGYNTDDQAFEYYDGADWVPLAGGGSSVWTTSTRPLSPVLGQEGFNTTTSQKEYWNGSVWINFSGGSAPNPVQLATPTGNTFVAGNGQGTQTWNNISDESGFIARISTHSDMTTATTASLSADTLNKTWTGLNNGTVYYTDVQGIGDGVNFSSSQHSAVSSGTPSVPGIPAPTLAAKTIEDSAKNYIKLHYGEALDGTSIPKASDFSVSSGRRIIGELPAARVLETSVSTIKAHPTSATFGVGLATFSFCNMFCESRIRSKAHVVKAKFYVGDLTNVTSFKLEIWRGGTGGSLTRITSQEVFSLLTPNSLNTITLPTPVDVLEDDKTGATIVSTTNTNGVLGVESTAMGADVRNGMRYQGTASGAFVVWGSQLFVDGYIPIELIGDHGVGAALLGDSNEQGYPFFSGYYHYGRGSNAEGYTQTLSFKLGALLQVSTVNMGIAGEQSNQILARINVAIAQHPQYLFINATINGGTNFNTDYAAMVTQALAGGIPYVFVESMTPSASIGGGAPGYNASLKTSIEAAGGIWIDSYSHLVNGSAGLLTQYKSDDNHVNAAGNALRAALYADAIAKLVPVTVTGSDVLLRVSRNYGTFDSETITYVPPSTNKIKSAAGINAVAFNTSTVTNNVVLAPEPVYYDVIDQFGELTPGNWTGNWGQADREMPKDGISWIGSAVIGAIPGPIAISDDITDIANFDPNAWYSFAKIGFTSGSGGYIWPFHNGNVQQISSMPVDPAKYYALYRNGVDMFIASSSDQVTWTMIYTYPDTFDTAVYAWSYGGAYQPIQYAMRLVGSADVIAPNIKAAFAGFPNTIVIEATEALTININGWTVKRNGAAITLTAVETIPLNSVGKRFRYALVTSAVLVGTDTLTVEYNASTGNTLDSSGNEIATFSAVAVLNAIDNSAFPKDLTFAAASSNFQFQHGIASTIANTAGGRALETKYIPASAWTGVVVALADYNSYFAIMFQPKSGILPATINNAGSYGWLIRGNTLYSSFNGTTTYQRDGLPLLPNYLYIERNNSGELKIYAVDAAFTTFTALHNAGSSSPGDQEVCIYLDAGSSAFFIHNTGGWI